MKTIHMMMGLPGSGKTTFSRWLHKQTGAFRLSADDLREMFYGDLSKITSYEFKAITTMASRFLARGEHVILDMTNTTEVARANALSLVQDNETEIYAYQFIMPAPLCINRKPHLEHIIMNMMRDFSPIHRELEPFHNIITLKTNELLFEDEDGRPANTPLGKAIKDFWEQTIQGCDNSIGTEYSKKDFG